MALPEDLDALCTQQLFRVAESLHLEDFDLFLDLQTSWSTPCELSWAAEVVGGLLCPMVQVSYTPWGRSLCYYTPRAFGTQCINRVATSPSSYNLYLCRHYYHLQRTPVDHFMVALWGGPLPLHVEGGIQNIKDPIPPPNLQNCAD